MSNKILIFGVIILAVGLFIFGRFYSGGISLNITSNNSASAAATLQNNNAPDFSLPRLGGGTIMLSEYRGKKPVILDFWASWCPNCRRDMPNLNRLYEKYKDRIEVIGVNLQESESAVQDFISARGITFPIALDRDSQVSNAYDNRYTNIHVLVNVSGNLIRTIPGDIQESDFVSLIQ